jgi:hypothetical protein
MIRRLGVDGMSSDESDSEDALNVTSESGSNLTRGYTILQPVWRAQGLSDWLHVFDSIHILGRRMRTLSSSVRGACPRHRKYKEGSKSKQSKCVRHLPHNAYDVHWLASQPVDNVDFEVQPDRECYEFLHDNSLFS